MGSGADSFKPRDHDDLIDHPTPVGCKNTKVNAVEYNRASVGARQKNYQEAALLTNNKCQEHGDNSNATDELALEREDEEVRFEQDCRASTESQQRIIAANVTQPSSLQNDVVDKAMLYLSNNRMPSEHTEIGNKMEYQSEPSKLLDPAKFILADIATEEEISDDVQNFVKNNPRKRRKLILLYDDDDDENEEEKAVDMQPEHVGPRSLKYDGPMTKHIVNTEYDEEATVLTGNLSNQNRNNGRPAKKRRYIDATNDEEDEAVVGAANSDCAVNNVANFALNDDANLVSETVVANGHCLQSRTISKSESADLHIFSQPAVEIVWSDQQANVLQKRVKSNCARFSSNHGLSDEFTETNFNLPNRVQLVGGNGKTNDERCGRKRPSLEDNEDEESNCKGVERLWTYKSNKKQRKDIGTNKYEDEMCDQHEVCVEDGTNELTQPATSKHYVEQRCDSCSKPIEEPRWSGIFKIDGKEYISLAGHFSTKSCEKVRNLSLPSVIEVTKVPRLAAWPKIWKKSRPTGDNIGLYLFPHKMRHDDDLDQLVKEVMDKDLVLRAIIDEAEMLIFPSVLLPERHQTFQTKHYLWAAFKAKEDRGDIIVEQEEDKEKHHVSGQLDDVQSEESDQETVLMKCAKPLEKQQLPSNSTQKDEPCCVQRPTNMRLEREAPEERRLRDSSHQAVGTSACTAVATDASRVANATIVPSEATSFATDTASLPTNRGPINPSMEAGQCSSSVFCIVVRQTPEVDPKVQQFAQEMERNGTLVAVMQGEEIGAGQWPRNMS
nr:unnamed protein product [Digitaria exilis]